MRPPQISTLTGFRASACALLLATGSTSTAEQPPASENEKTGRTTTIHVVESAAVVGEQATPSIDFFPLPEDIVFERYSVLAEGVDSTADATEQLVYSNTLGKFGGALGTGNLVSDDISTIVPGGCNLRRFEFPVLGKVNPVGIGGTYTVNFALYSSCPGSVPSANIPSLIIPNTQGAVTFTNQCQNAVDDDGDAAVNDGCVTVGPAETGAQCLNAADDDGDGKVNDGCPAVGPAETDADIPRLISFVPPADAPLPTNFWLGVKFSRNNAGVVFGTPPMVGFSCDQYDYPGFPCTAWAGGFPSQPHASFNMEIYTDSICTNSFTAYKNNNPAGPTFNPGQNVTFADDIQLSTAPPPAPPPTTVCNMIAYEIAVKGDATYHFDLRRNCDGNIIAGTEREYTIFEDPNPRIARFTFIPAIPIPNDFFLSARISAASGGVVVTGQQACIGRTSDSFQVAGPTGCYPTVYPPPPSAMPRIYAGFSAAITCAGAAPVGACCDMFITDENGDAVCRQVPEVNCPYPPRFLNLKPGWVQGAVCSPDPFSPQPCGVAACCKPVGGCLNLTLNECNALPPVDSPRQWQLGQFCNSQGQQCPMKFDCPGKTGECTLPRCRADGGVCNLTTHTCSAGMIGLACTSSYQCDCSGDQCKVNSSCCDICPPIGCGDVECCIIVCEQDAYCCNTEWDQTCADEARQMCDIRPDNDVCEGARLLTTGPLGDSAETDSGRATESPTDPGFGCYVDNPGAKGLQTVWYKFVATHNSVGLQTCNSNSAANDSLLAVFAVGDPATPETQCSSLIPIACGDDLAGCSAGGKNARVCIHGLIPGNLYYVMVASKNEVADGVGFQLDIMGICDSPAYLPSDFCPNAPPVPDGTTAFNFTNMTMDPPVEPCIPTMINDRWYNYTATCSGTLTIETCGQSPETSPDTNLAIYEDFLCPPVSGPPIACSTDAGGSCGLGSRVVLDTVPGSRYKIRLADSAGNRPSGNLKISCIQADCPVGVFTFTDPPNGVVDARRPYPAKNPMQLEGIQTITATGPRDALPSCFSLCDTVDSGNHIDSVVQGPIGAYTITLNNPIARCALTTITYTDIHGVQSTGRFTSHPGDVNDDETTSKTDVQALVDALNGTAALIWGKYSGDIDHSGAIAPADVLEEIDLMNGEALWECWNKWPNPIDDDACP